VCCVKNAENVGESRQYVEGIAFGKMLAEFLYIEMLELGKDIGVGLHTYQV